MLEQLDLDLNVDLSSVDSCEVRSHSPAAKPHPNVGSCTFLGVQRKPLDGVPGPKKTIITLIEAPSKEEDEVPKMKIELDVKV